MPCPQLHSESSTLSSFLARPLSWLPGQRKQLCFKAPCHRLPSSPHFKIWKGNVINRHDPSVSVPECPSGSGLPCPCSEQQPRAWSLLYHPDCPLLPSGPGTAGRAGSTSLASPPLSPLFFASFPLHSGRTGSTFSRGYKVGHSQKQYQKVASVGLQNRIEHSVTSGPVDWSPGGVCSASCPIYGVDFSSGPSFPSSLESCPLSIGLN